MCPIKIQECPTKFEKKKWLRKIFSILVKKLAYPASFDLFGKKHCITDIKCFNKKF